MIRFRHSGEPHALSIGMTGVKMGDRVAMIGCGDGARLAAIAGKVGLSGNAVAVVGDSASAERLHKAASQAGVLVDVQVAPSTSLPLDADAFDLAIVDDTGGMIASLGADQWSDTVREVHRVLRPGGRMMIIAAAPRDGLGALLSRQPAPSPFDPVPGLQADGFRSVRMLAEREGLRFIEGVKPRA